MPGPLKNPRHEAYCQARVTGKTLEDSQESAGLKRNKWNACRMERRPEVKARMDELKERAADKAVVTIEGITDRLLKIAKKGEDKEDAPLLQLARAALMDAAKLNGLIVDRSKLGFDLTGLTAEELAMLETILARTAKP